jgi:tetratricopeptide (TPR) repeat protein
MISIAEQSQSQDQIRIDSLTALMHGKTGNERVDILYQLSTTLLDDDNQLAFRFAREAFDMAAKGDNPLLVVRTGRVMGSALWRLQKLDSSIHMYTLMYKIAGKEGYQEELGLLATGLAIVHTFTAGYDKALQYYFQSLEIQRSREDTEGEIRTLINVGVVYYKLKDYKKALRYFSQSKEIQEKTGHRIDTDMLMNNIGLSYAYLRQFEEAIHHIDLGIEMCGAHCSDTRSMESLFAKGVVYMGLRDLQRSEGYFLQSYSLSSKLKNVRFQLDNIDYLSQIYLERKRPNDAAFYLHIGERIIMDYPAFNLENLKLFSRLSDLYRTLRDFETASDYQFKYTQLRDDVYSEELTNNLMRIEAKNLERENLRRIESQNKILALNQHIIDRQSMINRLSMILILITICLAGVLYRNYQQKKRINAFLDGKIGERTRELNNSSLQLTKAFHERDLMLDQANRAYISLVARIEGLYLNALKDVSDPVGRDYILKIGALVTKAENSTK